MARDRIGPNAGPGQTSNEIQRKFANNCVKTTSAPRIWAERWPGTETWTKLKHNFDKLGPNLAQNFKVLTGNK